MKYDADWVREQVLAADAYRLDARPCSLCGTMVGYDFLGGEVFFNSNCACVSYWRNPRLSSYEAISDWLFAQQTDVERDRIMAGMKRRAKPVPEEATDPFVLGTIEKPLAQSFVLNGDGRILLKLNADGTVEGDLDKASEAAQAFVDAVTTMWPAALNKAKADEQQALCTYLERLIEVARTNSNTEIVFPLQLILRDINAERHHDA
jgi:hypothetical protein